MVTAGPYIYVDCPYMKESLPLISRYDTAGDTLLRYRSRTGLFNAITIPFGDGTSRCNTNTFDCL